MLQPIDVICLISWIVVVLLSRLLLILMVIELGKPVLVFEYLVHEVEQGVRLEVG